MRATANMLRLSLSVFRVLSKSRRRPRLCKLDVDKTPDKTSHRRQYLIVTRQRKLGTNALSTKRTVKISTKRQEGYAFRPHRILALAATHRRAVTDDVAGFALLSRKSMVAHEIELKS